MATGTTFLTSSGSPTIHYYISWSTSSSAISFTIIPCGEYNTTQFGTGYTLKLLYRGGWTSSATADSNFKQSTDSWKASSYGTRYGSYYQIGPSKSYSIPTNGYSGSQNVVITIQRTDAVSSTTTGSLSSASFSVTIPSSGGGTTPTTYYYYRCYDQTNGVWLTSGTSTTSSSVTRPNYSSSGYTYVGYSTGTSYNNALSYGVEDDSTTGQGSTSYPYIVFYYEQQATTCYYYYYDTDENFLGGPNSTTSTSITAPTLSGYTYVGYVYHSSLAKALNQGGQGNYDSADDPTPTTCTDHGSTYPYVVFFYQSNTCTLYINCIDVVTGTLMTTQSATFTAGTSPSIYSKTSSQVSYGGYTYYEYSSLYNNTSATVSTTTTVNWYYSKKYNLTINPNGGSYSGSTSSTSVSQLYNLTATVSNPTRSGYNFTGWTLSGGGSLNGTTYTFGSSNGTLTANWQPITYTLTYNANGGSGGPDSTTSSSWTINLTNQPTRENYTFKGWATTTSAITPTYKVGTSYSTITPSDNQTLYAVWWPIFSWDNTYTAAKANTLINYITTYYGDSLNSLTAGSVLYATWYNNIAKAINSSSSVLQYDVNTIDQLEALAEKFNDQSNF